MAPKGSPVVAVTAGTVTRIKHDQSGTSGNYLSLKGDDGWTYQYMHLNNDTPGSDDASNLFENAFAPGVEVGSRVSAGDHLGYVGDSGNAEDAGSHLHFEMRMPDGALVNAYPSLRAAASAPSIVSPIGTWRSS